MRKLALCLAVIISACAVRVDPASEPARWERQARNVTIIRDDWGIAHVYGKTDADAVFGAMYAQAEDDFNRVETNYINSMGRLAEAEGESRIYRDLRMKLFIDPDSLKAMYERAPEWIRALMNAFADGLNFYLHTHPEVKPRVIQRFEPWMALSFSEGSIGGDIERVNVNQLESFYSRPNSPGAGRAEGRTAAGASAVARPFSSVPFAGAAAVSEDREAAFAEPSGSNGIAIAPANTANGRALLLINPHTSFFFRSELQMVSEEGLNAYGASTWGQFFIYQGFNDRAGWMHTSSGVDNIDEYLETVTQRGDSFFYRVGSEERPLTTYTITVPYRADTASTELAEKRFTVYRTHRGPIVRAAEGKWVSVRMMEEPLKALMQSFARTKARNLKEFLAIMESHTNSSNNTVFADAEGNIAYLHSNFIPRRETRFDWTRPVDGSDPATEWNGLHSVDESPNAINPASGWVYCTNNWPWSAAGPDSPRRDRFPAYMETASENARGVHAIMLLENTKDFTLNSLVAAAYDSYLPWFREPIPALIAAWDAAPASDPLKSKLERQVELLRGWDLRWSAASIPTSLGVFWGEEMLRRVGNEPRRAGLMAEEFIGRRAGAAQLLQALAAASDQLAADFGKWETPWGDINRFQRLTADIDHPFDDSQPSIGVPFTSARWGSLASFGARAYPNTKKWYGTSGNSFVAVVEFGDSVRARAVTAGGESGDPSSPHFNDQALRYSTGDLREVYFYKSQLRGRIEREYRPGG